MLRQHNILSMATWVAGFVDQTVRDMLYALRQLITYDPDQIQALYVAPHRWTPYCREAEGREVVQTDKTKWNYKHQVLAMRKMPPWRLFLWVRLIEVVTQTRPRASPIAMESRAKDPTRHPLVLPHGATCVVS